MSDNNIIMEYLLTFQSISRSLIQYYANLQAYAGKYAKQWRHLHKEERDRLQFYFEIQDAVEQEPYSFSLVVSFELKSVRWMEQEIQTTLQRMEAGKLSQRAAINFIWDIERSHIRDHSCRFLRSDLMNIQNRIREVSRQTEKRKSILMGIYYDDPSERKADEVQNIQAKPPVSSMPSKKPSHQVKPAPQKVGQRISLPHAAFAGAVSLEECLLVRRSVKEYKDQPIRLAEAAQLLWAGQGITDPRGFRTSPSGMALFPLDLRFVAGNVDGLPAGVYRYDPFDHELERTLDGDRREDLSWATYDQDWMKNCAFLIIVTAFETPAAGLTAEQVERFVSIESGHVAQNIFLQAAVFGIGMVGIGHFSVERLGEVFNLKSHEHPVYVLVGGRR